MKLQTSATRELENCKAHFSQEDGSSGGPKTKPKALSDPQGDKKGEVGGKVERDEAKTRNEVAEQEHLLPPQHLAGRDARQYAQGHAHLVLVACSYQMEIAKQSAIDAPTGVTELNQLAWS